MNKIIKIAVISLVLVGISGCMESFKNGINGAFNKFSNAVLNIDKDSTVILAGAEIINTPEVLGKGELILENIQTGETKSINIDHYSKSNIQKITPGTYKIAKWNFDSCAVVSEGDYCKSWHDFGGVNTAIPEHTFTIKKGEVVYLGKIIIDSNNQTLSIQDNSSSDIAGFRKNVDALKTRDIKNISNQLSITNWKFKITGAGLFK